MGASPCDDCPARANGVFSSLSRAQAQELARSTVLNTYKRGQVLFYEGNHSNGVFCVYAGKVKLYKGGSLGRQYIIRIETGGSLLGYRNILTKQPYHYAAEAIEDSTICFINKTTFMSLLSGNPAVALMVMKKLSLELSDLEQKTVDLVDKSSRVRLARLLLDLKDKHSKASPAGVELTIRLSREELAEAIGITRETATRLLSQFREGGVLDLDGPRILIKDCPSLVRIARVAGHA